MVGNIKGLIDSMKSALNVDNIPSTKIDGAPALVLWNDFPGIEGPGVAFKTLPKQLLTGNPKDYFTDPEAIETFMNQKAADQGVDLTHRKESFKEGLMNIAANIKPGIMLWGDVLWANESEVKRDGDSVTCKPNTIEYTFWKKDFPNIDKSFGICIHTLIDHNFENYPVENANAYGNFKDAFVLSKGDIQLGIDTSKVSSAKQAVQEFESFVSSSKLLDVNFDEFRKAYKRAAKVTSGNDIANVMASDSKLSKFVNDPDEVKDFIMGLNIASKANSAIVDMYTNPIQSSVNGVITDGEGYVIQTSNGYFKFVKDDFTEANVAHIRGLKESVQSSSTIAYSSSKMSDLLKHYYGFSLEYGNGGGSNFGFATYLVTEPPFSSESGVGWSDDVRKKLYGENVFEFEISNKKLFFFDFENYKIVNPNADENNYIEEQLTNLGIELSDAQIAMLYPDAPNNSSKNATRLFKYLSRIYYQGKKGNLRTPLDGFVYTGKQDGKVLVVWGSYALRPTRVSNDCGQTWTDCDKNSLEYKEYIAKTSNYDYKSNQEGRKARIFDGNPTPEKEKIYRMLMAYNSNDGEANGKEILSIAEGIFYSIVIHDDKTISAGFKYNLAQADSYIQFFRLRQNQFIDKILEAGYRFKDIKCDGLKIGGDTDKEWHISQIPEGYFPENLNYKYLKVVNHSGAEVVEALEKIIPKCTTLKTLVLRACEVTAEVLEIAKEFNLNIIYESTKKKSCVDEEGNSIEPTN